MSNPNLPMQARWLAPAATLFGMLAILWSTGGCVRDPDPSATDQGGSPAVCTDEDHDGYGAGCTLGADCDDTDPAVTNGCYNCRLNETGCPCKTEGKQISCGTIAEKVGESITCNYGMRTCSGGAWGECVPTPSPSPAPMKPMVLGNATGCQGDPCDPYCQQYCDKPDPALGDGGLTASDGGITISWDGGIVEAGTTWDAAPNGPMPDSIRDTLNDAGALPDGGYLYHELPPNTASTQDPLNVQAQVKTIDVYFLVDTTASMADEINTIADTISQTNGIIDTIRVQVPDAWFGIGHFEEYYQSPWNGGGTQTRAYQHVLNIDQDKNAAQSAANWLKNQIHGNSTFPEAWGPAMWSMGTGSGLYRSGSGASITWWVPPHDANWASPQSGQTGACAAGRTGYPCFRSTATPIVVAVSDAPTENGPGGQYAYTHDSSWGLTGSSAWPSPTAVVGNDTAAGAYVINDIGVFGAYSGATSSFANDQSFPTNLADCTSSSTRGASGRDAFFKFTVSQETWFHFDTFGSNFDTVLYLLRADNSGVTCDDDSYIASGDRTSSIDGFVPAGTYYVVVDGYSTNSGNYVLHVNAMADSTPLTAPIYDQQLSAFQTLGGKFIGISSAGLDKNGSDCDYGHQDETQRTVYDQMRKWAVDTNSRNGLTQEPYVFTVNSRGGPCHSGDPSLPTAMANAVVDMTQYSRVDVTIEAADLDDQTDFDGPPGGSNIVTPFNVDDATFLNSVTTVPTAETNTRCQQTLGNKFVQCLPGTHVQFAVDFRTPATITQLSAPQIFGFVVRVVADGTSVLGETPVVIVVPPLNQPSTPGGYGPMDFERVYDTADVCPPGTRAYWGRFIWDTIDPYDSNIKFYASGANTTAALSSATEIQFATARSQPAPNTEVGYSLIDQVFVSHNQIAQPLVLKIRAHFEPSSDHLAAPTLYNWKQEISCQPTE